MSVNQVGSQACSTPGSVWRAGSSCTLQRCKALHLHCSFLGGFCTPSFCCMGCPGNHRGNGAKHSGDEASQFREDAHIARELQQSQQGGLAMVSSCSLALRLITQGGCRQVFGLLVCSCWEGYGDNPAPENIFPWKTKERNIYTIFVALSCLPPLTLITAS